MIQAVNNLRIGSVTGLPASSPAPRTAPVDGKSFAEVLKNNINEVSRLQEDASQAVQSLASGKTENIAGVISAVEKSDLAFQTLLAIRAKLMEAFEEIKGMSV